MAATIIYDDGKIRKVQTDDGKVVTVPYGAGDDFMSTLGVTTPSQSTAHVNAPINMPKGQFASIEPSIVKPTENFVDMIGGSAPAQPVKNPSATGSWDSPGTGSWEDKPVKNPTRKDVPMVDMGQEQRPIKMTQPTVVEQSPITDNSQSSTQSDTDKFVADAEARKKKMETDYNAVTSQTVDPNRYSKSKNSAQTAIALVLGGIGQGLARSNSNMAADYINKRIEEDIDSQKADLTNKNSMFGKFYQSTGDIEQSILMARKYETDHALEATRIKLDDKRLTEQQRINLMQLQSNLQNNSVSNAKNLQEMAINSAKMGMQQTSDPVMNKIMTIPDETVKRKALEEYGQARINNQSLKAIGDIFDKVGSTGILKGSIPFTDTKKDIDTNIELFKTEFAKSMGGIITESDLRMADKLAPSRTDTESQTKTKKLAVQAYISRRQRENKGAPTLNAYGIEPQFNTEQPQIDNNKQIQDTATKSGFKK